MVLLEFQHPLGHGRPPEPIHGLTSPEHLTIQLIILLEHKRQVLLHRYHIVPINTVPGHQLNIPMKRVLHRSYVALYGSQPDIGQHEDAHQEIVQRIVGDKILFIVGVGDLVGSESHEPDNFTQCFVLGCLHE